MCLTGWGLGRLKMCLTPLTTENTEKSYEMCIYKNRHATDVLIAVGQTSYLGVQTCFTSKKRPTLMNSNWQVTEEEKRSMGDEISVKMSLFSDTIVRFVFHIDISEDSAKLAAKKLTYVLREINQDPWAYRKSLIPRNNRCRNKYRHKTGHYYFMTSCKSTVACAVLNENIISYPISGKQLWHHKVMWPQHH